MRTRQAAAFSGSLAALNVFPKNGRALVAKVGLCRGLLAQSSDEAAIDLDFALLREFLDAERESDAQNAGKISRWMSRGLGLFNR